MLFLFQRCQHRVGDSAHAQLQGSAVLDERSAVAADGHVLLAALAPENFRQGMGRLYDPVKIIDMHISISPNSGHLLINLCDNRFC